MRGKEGGGREGVMIGRGVIFQLGVVNSNLLNSLQPRFSASTYGREGGERGRISHAVLERRDTIGGFSMWCRIFLWVI